MRSSLILKVNKEGTALDTVCPKPSKRSHILVLLPVAMTTFFAKKWPLDVSS